jgi:hypothetical protein
MGHRHRPTPTGHPLTTRRHGTTKDPRGKAGHTGEYPIPPTRPAPQHTNPTLTTNHIGGSGLSVTVPDEVAVDLDELDFEVVEGGHDFGRPVLGEEGELIGEVDHGLRHSTTLREACPARFQGQRDLSELQAADLRRDKKPSGHGVQQGVAQTPTRVTSTPSNS